MSHALYGPGGLRFWTQREILIREHITARIVEAVTRPLLDLNNQWRFERVETPVMMPRELMSAAYDDDDVFALKDDLDGRPYALRAETTQGTYAIAHQLIRSTSMKPPIGFWQSGLSFRRERADGANAAKLRFNAFHQLEFQLIHGVSTTAPIRDAVRESLLKETAAITGLPTRIVPSDRLPSYATETIDIECEWERPTGDGTPEWKEVASTSLRTDFPPVPGFVTPKGAPIELQVFEVAYGLDRMVAMANREI